MTKLRFTDVVMRALAILALSLAPSLSLTAYAQNHGDQVVRQLRDLPTSLPGIARSDATIDPIEQRRDALYQQLLQLGDEGSRALAEGLRDPDVQLRRNVALALLVLSGGWRAPAQKLDIRAYLPALVAALRDDDGSVRARVAQAIGEIGPDAAPAVSALVTLLTDSDEGSRNSACIALYGIGPVAKGALPALRKSLSDPSADVRRFAQRAIEKIEGQR